MSVPAAYLGVILIWTTTPLAIKWSAAGSHFLFAVTARMWIGAVLSLVLLRLSRTSFPWHRKARQTYLAVGGGIFGALGLTYWGAQYIPSGLISVIFGLAPLVTGLFASLVLGEKNLGPLKLIGMLFGLGGLAIVFSGNTAAGAMEWRGIAAVLAAMLIHCASAVRVKQLAASIPALASTAGGVLVATFLLQTCWILLDVRLPTRISPLAGWSIIYLGIAGSVLGFSLYFFLLKHVEATRVTLITLITPVLALMLGNLLNGEALNLGILSGTAVILFGLVCFQYGDFCLLRLRKVFRRVRPDLP